MKLKMLCTKCLHDNNDKELNYVNVEMSDNGIYKFKCNKGHENFVYLQKAKFEILFDFGVMAMLDGYQREAVSSFAASLERFYEYCIEVFLTNNNVNLEQYSKIWRLVSNQSERQLGAYFFLYLSEFGEVPKEFNQEQTRFRNKVIHKGYIPKNEEVIKYAEYVYDYIMEIGALIRNKYYSAAKRVLDNQQVRARNSNKDERVNYDARSELYLLTIIDILDVKNNLRKKTLKEALIKFDFKLKGIDNLYIKE